MDLISSKSYYNLKMIPLVSIKNHILKDFYPYFFIFNSSIDNILAFNNPQTHVKSYNEKFLKRDKENVAYHKSNLNTVKILFLKFHENSHSKYSSNFKFDASPQFLYKYDLSILNNDKAISEGIIQNITKYKYKNYIEKEIQDSKDDQNYFEDVYQFLEDQGDEIENPIDESHIGESGAAIEYYLCNNYLCTNEIIKYNGNLEKLLNIEFYTGSSLLKLKRIIEKKLKMVIKEKTNSYINKVTYHYLNLKKIKKKPNEMIKHEDIGLLINI